MGAALCRSRSCCCSKTKNVKQKRRLSVAQRRKLAKQRARHQQERAPSLPHHDVEDATLRYHSGSSSCIVPGRRASSASSCLSSASTGYRCSSDAVEVEDQQLDNDDAETPVSCCSNSDGGVFCSLPFPPLDKLAPQHPSNRLKPSVNGAHTVGVISTTLLMSNGVSPVTPMESFDATTWDGDGGTSTTALSPRTGSDDPSTASSQSSAHSNGDLTSLEGVQSRWRGAPMAQSNGALSDLSTSYMEEDEEVGEEERTPLAGNDDPTSDVSSTASTDGEVPTSSDDDSDQLEDSRCYPAVVKGREDIRPDSDEAHAAASSPAADRRLEPMLEARCYKISSSSSCQSARSYFDVALRRACAILPAQLSVVKRNVSMDDAYVVRVPSGLTSIVSLLSPAQQNSRLAYRASVYNTLGKRTCKTAGEDESRKPSFSCGLSDDCSPCVACGACTWHVKTCHVSGDQHSYEQRVAANDAACCSLLPSSHWLQNIFTDEFVDPHLCLPLDHVHRMIQSFAPDWIPVLEAMFSKRCIALLHAACTWGGLGLAVACTVDFVIQRPVNRSGLQQQARPSWDVTLRRTIVRPQKAENGAPSSYSVVLIQQYLNNLEGGREPPQRSDHYRCVVAAAERERLMDVLDIYAEDHLGQRHSKKYLTAATHNPASTVVQDARAPTSQLLPAHPMDNRKLQRRTSGGQRQVAGQRAALFKQERVVVGLPRSVVG